jgi:hypothetical protein
MTIVAQLVRVDPSLVSCMDSRTTITTVHGRMKPVVDKLRADDLTKYHYDSFLIVNPVNLLISTRHPE